MSASIPDKQDDFTTDIDTVISRERRMINDWRNRNGRSPLSDTNKPSDSMDTTGVAISGGGIRSASFALGALQALDQNLTALAQQRHAEKKLEGNAPGGMACIDYLSTVSGGGYIGTSLRVGMEKLDGAFPFSTGTGDKSDNLSVGHLRNYSRYLLPKGIPDLIGSLAVILRGLIANIAMVLSVVLVLAGLTGLFNPNQEAFSVPDFFGLEGFPYPPFVLPLGSFAYTKIGLVLALAGFCLWSLLRSVFTSRTPEFQGQGYNLAWWSIVFLAFMAFLEFQPFAITALFKIYGNQDVTGWQGILSGWISALTPYAAPLATLAALASKIFGDTLKTNSGESGFKPFAKRSIAKALFWFIALVLPLTIWVTYLHLTLTTDIYFMGRPEWMQKLVTWSCGAPDVSMAIKLIGTAPCDKSYLVSIAFVKIGMTVLAISLLYSANANSLHRLYRDRLSKAFLFDPTGIKTQKNNARATDPAELGIMPFSALNGTTGPLHLVNAAINLHGSEKLNRRGRNADFFFFSNAYSGSTSTGFIRTGAESFSRELPDLGAAMAISGAAASSNMGSNSIKGLAPTLALLNIRLGYWMKNPKHMSDVTPEQNTSDHKSKAKTGIYLVDEILGFLDENAPKVYLSDGGHIENLGLYELLRRRCKTILVIDAEADPQMTFGSFVTAQRYARLDLGIRIDLPWQAIAAATHCTSREIQEDKLSPKSDGQERPHCAIGTIDYGSGQTGTLIYLKSSLTGDENDYIRNYKIRNPAFPHETTGDQFFSEEQFEAYRALGFHALHGAFTGKAKIERLPSPVNQLAKLEVKTLASGKKTKTKVELAPRLQDYF